VPFGASSAYLDLLCRCRSCGDGWVDEGGGGGGDGGGGGGDGGGGSGNGLVVGVVCGGCGGGGGDLRAERAGGTGVNDDGRGCDEERGGCGGKLEPAQKHNCQLMFSFCKNCSLKLRSLIKNFGPAG